MAKKNSAKAQKKKKARDKRRAEEYHKRKNATVEDTAVSIAGEGEGLWDDNSIDKLQKEEVPSMDDTNKLENPHHSNDEAKAEAETEAEDIFEYAGEISPLAIRLNAMMVAGSSFILRDLSKQSKGIRVFAKEDLPAGRYVMSETPLLTSRSNSHCSALDLASQFAMLPEDRQRNFWELHDAKMSDTDPILSIYSTNCVSWDDGLAASVFLSRIGGENP